MKIVTAGEMKNLESKSFELYGIDGALMMEHAAISLYLAIEEEIGNLSGKKILVIAGKGNNGGDAFSAARTFIEAGANVKVYLALGEPTGELPRKNLSILIKLGMECKNYSKENSKEFVDDLKWSDLVLDGILGTGTNGTISDELGNLIDLVNENSKFTVSIDLPTGLNADGEASSNRCIMADMTVTFGFIKRGMLFYPGRTACGKIKIGKIGIPQKLIDSQFFEGELTTFDDAKMLLPTRPKLSNKGTFGKVLIISGSSQYTGTPVMVSLGALRVGAGLVFATVPAPFNTVITSSLPEAISIPLDEEKGFISTKSIETIDEFAEKASVIAIGPGLGDHDESVEVIKHVLSKFNDKPMIIDADGLTLISKDIEGIKFNDRMIITPHPGEFSRLTSINAGMILSNPVKYAREFARSKNVNVLLKGPTTVIAMPDERYTLNITGNTGLAKGGTGDVLTGMIAGFAAQGMDVFHAAQLSAYIHGRTSELYSKDKSEASMLPRDLVELIPQILYELSQ